MSYISLWPQLLSPPRTGNVEDSRVLEAIMYLRCERRCQKKPKSIFREYEFDKSGFYRRGAVWPSSACSSGKAGFEWGVTSLPICILSVKQLVV